MLEKQKGKLTKEECLEMGGHCFVDSGFVTSNINTVHHRHCKHCGKRQRGMRQPDIDWIDE